jgi:hypothetical protein
MKGFFISVFEAGLGLKNSIGLGLQKDTFVVVAERCVRVRLGTCELGYLSGCTVSQNDITGSRNGRATEKT